MRRTVGISEVQGNDAARHDRIRDGAGQMILEPVLQRA